MTKELLEVLIRYSKNYNDYSDFINNENNDNLKMILTDLLVVSMNDKNSSSLREKITAVVSGYNHSEDKLGYDAFKLVDGKKIDFVEIKPKNIFLNDYGKLNSKLDGSGNFSDFNWNKFNKMKDDNVTMIVSGFSSGKLIYILKFPYNFSEFVDNLERQLLKKLPNRIDIKNIWLRSASFSFKHYKNSNNLEIIYVTKDIVSHKNELTKTLYDFLKNNNIF